MVEIPSIIPQREILEEERRTKVFFTKADNIA
jgi:hypothetical protein